MPNKINLYRKGKNIQLKYEHYINQLIAKNQTLMQRNCNNYTPKDQPPLLLQLKINKKGQQKLFFISLFFIKKYNNNKKSSLIRKIKMKLVN